MSLVALVAGSVDAAAGRVSSRFTEKLDQQVIDREAFLAVYERARREMRLLEKYPVFMCLPSPAIDCGATGEGAQTIGLIAGKYKFLPLPTSDFFILNENSIVFTSENVNDFLELTDIELNSIPNFEQWKWGNSCTLSYIESIRPSFFATVSSDNSITCMSNHFRCFLTRECDKDGMFDVEDIIRFGVIWNPDFDDEIPELLELYTK